MQLCSNEKAVNFISCQEAPVLIDVPCRAFSFDIHSTACTCP